jgi:AbrB family looped-hinge helix DNA binding protein
MKTTTLSSKGQVTLPAALLRELHLGPGTRLYVVPTERSIVLVPVEGSLAERLAGSMRGHYGDPEAYVDGERTSWTSEA